MDVSKFIKDWLNTSNRYDIEKYLQFYLPDVVWDDLSVGRKFTGLKGIREYFDNYFIGYNTQTRLTSLVVKNNEQAYVEVEFTGDFPEGKIGGYFNFTFKENKIAFVSADLIQH